MKLLNILYELRYSGAETMLESAAEHLKEKGFELSILATGPNLGPFSSKLRKKGYRLAHVHLTPSLKSAYLLLRFYIKERFDVIHIYAEKWSFLHVVFSKIGNPRCTIVRSYVDVYNIHGIRRWRRILERFLARTAFGVVNISIGPSVQKCEVENFKNPSEVLLDWIDVDYFRPATSAEKAAVREKLGININAQVVAAVGTCNPKKNHLAILYSLSRLCRELPSLVFLHRGTGPDTEMERQEAHRLKIGDQTIFLEYLEDVRSVFWASDVFVTPSHYEGMGNVNMEAMSCGVPVVLYDVEGMKDLNFSGQQKGGFWVQPKDSSLDAPIHTLLRDEHVHAKKATEARAVAEENFNLAKSLDWLICKYKGTR